MLTQFILSEVAFDKKFILDDDNELRFYLNKEFKKGEYVTVNFNPCGKSSVLDKDDNILGFIDKGEIL